MIILIGLPILVIAATICFKMRADIIFTLFFSALAGIFAVAAITYPTKLSEEYNDLLERKDELIIELHTYDYNAVNKEVMERKISRFNENYEDYKKEYWLAHIFSAFQEKPEDISFPDDYLESVLNERQGKDKQSNVDKDNKR